MNLQVETVTDRLYEIVSLSVLAIAAAALNRMIFYHYQMSPL